MDTIPFTWDARMFVADFHVHSHFSRATSRDMHPYALNEVAKQKGIFLVGTGDFTHPGYLEELKKELEPDGNGFYVCKGDPEGTRFILTAEVANIFTQAGRNRRIHTCIFAPDFETVEEIQKRLDAIGNITSDGRPIFGFPVKELVRIVMDCSADCLVLPAHIWTPWFSLFGAKSGFDKLEECFEEQSCHIYALETGLSSDPQMNWRLSCLDRYTLVSNSDAHSPSRLGREANIFSCQPTYKDIISAIKKDKPGFEGTIEFFPEEGKYHYDGHRACKVCLKPTETLKKQGLCPACGKPVTIGVLHRVEELSDRPEGFVPPGARPCVHLIPLEEILAAIFRVKTITKRVHREYLRLIELAGPELDILLWKTKEELSSVVPAEVLAAIGAMREGNVRIRPGFDGEYGHIVPATIEPIDHKGRRPGPKSSRCRQIDLF